MLHARTRFLPFRGVRYRICELSATSNQSKDYRYHYRYHAYGRNQFKRNFWRAGLWSRYRALRFSQKIPSPNLSQIAGFSQQLSRGRLAYFWALYVRTEPSSGRQRLYKWLLRLTGWRGIKLVAAVIRIRRWL
jgi:hypothetical protein